MRRTVVCLVDGGAVVHLVLVTVGNGNTVVLMADWVVAGLVTTEVTFCTDVFHVVVGLIEVTVTVLTLVVTVCLVALTSCCTLSEFTMGRVTARALEV